MNSLIPCLGLLLLVFGGRLGSSEALSVPFMTSHPSDSDRVTFMSLLRGEPITGDVNVERDFDGDAADLTETLGHTGWICHPNICIYCVSIRHHKICISVSALNPVGFLATASADKKPFLASKVTSNGSNAVATGVIPDCWFGMEFLHINVKQRSAASYVGISCKNIKRKVALGRFKIPMKSQGEKEDVFNFGTGTTGLSEAVEALFQGDE